MRILIADDNESVRRGVANMLAKDARLEVCGEAANGEEALQKAQEFRPDLILLDINMPGLSGYETARLLREQLAEIKILVMSFDDAVQLLPSVRKAGADGCVDKARLGADLLSSINSFLPGGNETQNTTVKRASAGHAGALGAQVDNSD
jgi:DNA-binding NarL/FixJ family response regulator